MTDTRPDVRRRGVSRRTVLQGGLGLAALLGLPAVTSCAATPGHHAGVAETGGLNPLTVDLARAEVPLSRVDVAPVVDGMRQFGAELYRRAASVTANWTMSPMSMDVCFAMLRAGARGTTAKQIDHVFGFPASTAPAGSFHAVLNALTAQLTSDRPVPTSEASPSKSSSGYVPPPAPIVAIANGLFIDTSFESQVQKAFLQVLAGQYGARPDLVRFADSSAAATINAWVDHQTRGRITKLFDQLDPGTRLVLANAVYLKAGWALPFEAEETKVGAFTTARGHRVDAHLMHQRLTEVAYAAGDGWQRVSLPYAGDELVMRIVVPTRPARDVATLARALAAAVKPGTDPAGIVDLTLPRWGAETSLSLTDQLAALGMPAAFNAQADLSGIAPGLYVSDAIHRANITVDEKGTEAAAVTGIAIASSAMIGRVATVRADRPFAWAIVHVPTGTPMFTGHVVDPTL